MGSGPTGVSPEKKLSPFDTLILPVFVFRHSYRITKTVSFFCIHQIPVASQMLALMFILKQTEKEKASIITTLLTRRLRRMVPHVATPMPSMNLLCFYHLSEGRYPFSLFLNSLFLCTFSFSHLKPRSSCQPNFAISSTIGSAFYVVPSWISSPQHFPLSPQPFISSLAFNTMAEMICMFFLLLLHGVSISAPKIFFSCESMKTHFKLS